MTAHSIGVLTLNRRVVAAFAVVAAIELAACNVARRVEGKATGCADCHGGGDNLTGAPPRDLGGRTATTAPGVGAHTAHVAPPPDGFGLACVACHPDPRSGSSTHRNGRVDLAFGPLANRQAPDAAPPSFDTAAATCSNVYCHGSFQGGNGSNLPTWTRVGQGQAACGTCHGLPPGAPHPSIGSDLKICNGCHSQTVDASGQLIPAALGGKHLDGLVESSSPHLAAWMDPADVGFHAVDAVKGLDSCQGCHGPALDQLPAGDCARCHGVSLPAGGTSWSRNCVMCHGGTDSPTGAPPRATWGNQATALAAGAHSAHVGLGDTATTTRGGLALKLGCEACHVKPMDAFTAGHLDGAVAVTGYSGSDPFLVSAVQAPGWTPATTTCATAYCHGATLQGGTHTAPVWTPATGTQATCGACHGLPPATGPVWATSTPAHLIPKHIQAGCGRCHDGFTVRSVNPALHVNGRRDVSLTYSAPSPDPASPEPPTLAACTGSTMTTTSRVTGWDCAACHRYRDYLYYRCCSDPGAPDPDWCATYW